MVIRCDVFREDEMLLRLRHLCAKQTSQASSRVQDHIIALARLDRFPKCDTFARFNREKHSLAALLHEPNEPTKAPRRHTRRELDGLAQQVTRALRQALHLVCHSAANGRLVRAIDPVKKLRLREARISQWQIDSVALEEVRP